MFVSFANAKSSVLSRRRQTHGEPKVRGGAERPCNSRKPRFSTDLSCLVCDTRPYRNLQLLNGILYCSVGMQASRAARPQRMLEAQSRAADTALLCRVFFWGVHGSAGFSFVPKPVNACLCKHRGLFLFFSFPPHVQKNLAFCGKICYTDLATQSNHAICR